MMKPDSKSVIFRRLVDQLRGGCAQRSVEMDDGVAELILADRITSVARVLRVGDQRAMCWYFHDDAIGDLIDICVRVRAEQRAEVDLASPMLLPITHAAT